MQKKAHAPMPVHYVKECGAKVPWTRVDSGEMLDSDHIYGGSQERSGAGAAAG